MERSLAERGIGSQLITLTGKLLEKFNSTSPCAHELNAITARLAKKDATLWGSDAENEAKSRLNWIDLPTTSRELLPQLDALSAYARSKNLTNVILCGMGGSSLAQEVMAKTYGKELTVLDTTDPDQILAGIPQSLANTVVVVGSKSGSTIETGSHLTLFIKLFEEADLDPKDHLVIITDPNSPLDRSARESGLRVINADPNVGGRYSALTAFGLTPAALLGIDISVLLDDADAARNTFEEAGSTVVKMATLLFEQIEPSVAFCDTDSQVPGISDWIEQLIAESTGKNGNGRLPVVIESANSKWPKSMPVVGFDIAKREKFEIIVQGTLGAQFIFWEWVTALLARALQIDPFNQPNVTEAKERTSKLITQWNGDYPAQNNPSFEDTDVAIFADAPETSLEESLRNFLSQSNGYFAVMAFLNRNTDRQILATRELISRATDRPTTFGWGPRFLHSTGQFHKGGPQNGAFLQITGENLSDLGIPGRNFTFHTLLMAQALGDGQALRSRQLPFIQIHLKNRTVGIEKIITALQELLSSKKN